MHVVFGAFGALSGRPIGWWWPKWRLPILKRPEQEFISFRESKEDIQTTRIDYSSRTLDL